MCYNVFTSLIDTLWNVKTNLLLRYLVIATYWNVKTILFKKNFFIVTFWIVSVFSGNN